MAPQAARAARLEEGHPWRLACGGLKWTPLEWVPALT